jgi:hypothetical protein
MKDARLGSRTLDLERVFRAKNRRLAAAVQRMLEAERPMTARQLFYRLVSSGYLPSTSKPHYNRLLQVLKRLREMRIVPLDWLVDNLRTTLKPSSWSGLADFGEAVRQSYRRDFWPDQGVYIEFIVEKDAVAGTLQPVTEEFDVPLRVARGYASISFAGHMAGEYRRIRKPIFLYYAGDFDASGFDIERDLVEKLRRYTGSEAHRLLDHEVLQRITEAAANEDFEEAIELGLNESGVGAIAGHGLGVRAGDVAFVNAATGFPIYFTRLGVRAEDFDELDLLPLDVKASDTRARSFRRSHGERCAEIDAIPPTELRARVRQAITQHIDQFRWARLKRVEQIEKETLTSIVSQLEKVKLASLSDTEDGDDEQGVAE